MPARRVTRMTHRVLFPGFPRPGSQRVIAVACAALLATGDLRLSLLIAQQNPAPAGQTSAPAGQAPAGQAPADQDAPPIPPDQLDSLVAPIALYPDPLLSQVLVASTYPLEIVQLQQWLEKNPNLKDKALTDAAMKQPWDPSIQAMSALPDVVKRLANDIEWTTDLGNAFLAQQSDVMDAVQRMRKKAQAAGALKSTEQQKVETQTVEGNKQVIVVQPSSPDVVYVPSYNPTVVYGPPPYPYPPIYYPPPVSTGAVIASSMISFGVGMAVGAAMNGGWGWGCGWGGGNVNVNVNNNFNRNSSYNRNTNVSGNRTGNNTWQHNSAHRGGAPYSNRATANKFGGTTRGESLGNRQANGRQQTNRQGGNAGANRGGTAGGGNLGANRGGGQNNLGANRASGQSNLGANRSSGSGGGDRVGNRDVPRSQGGSSGANKSAFGSGSGGYNRGSASANSSRGSRSMSGGGSRGGGGGSRGGGRRR
jgi:Protein of unknown function (DUF3300)